MRRESNVEQTAVPVVENLLPQFVVDNWTFDRMRVSNPSYPPSSYTGSNIPEGNIIIVFPDGTYPETFVYPNEEYWPYLNIGHSYYIRFHAKKEKITNASGGNPSSNNINVNYEFFWPEKPNSWFNNINNNSTEAWYKYGQIFTPTASQWTTSTTDGVYKCRFDCNNNKKYIKYLCLGDFMLINLTKCYTMQGYAIPSLSTLNSRPYFYGTLPITDWV